MTYTVANMQVSQSTFDEIKGKLEQAGYEHAIHREFDVVMLDMTHISLVVESA